MSQPLEDWFKVSFDDSEINLDVHPAEQDIRKTQIPWADIIRVCFKPGDFLSSDEIYIFTNQRPESYLIPTEAFGGFELWAEIINRGLFDAELAIDVVSKSEGVFCWPEE
ncbi:MAG: hypothetical protein ISR58_04555 [Anaerolineales bacterium]|nr:hypothetical protein [Chloroflexota bacterium]MBL6980443.1 hypothetical protein [Anaerolineales bacterium]